MPLIEPQEIPSLASLGRTHFIAIGGAGMSGVATGFLERGIPVSGSDHVDSDVLQALGLKGARVWVGHDARHLEEVDTVVVSTAIQEDNVELVEARRRGLPVIHRSVALASLMEGFQVVSVAGTHGKTTTTAMCVAGLQGAGQDPSYVIGGTMVDTGLGAHSGSGPWFVVEADESDGSFRQYPTGIAVVTGVEADHMDNWITAERYRRGFEEFAGASTVSVVILDGDDPGAALLGESLRARGRQVVSYGQSPSCDLRLTGVNARGSEAVLVRGQWSALLRLAVPGVHNLRNAAAACCVGQALGVDMEEFLAGLARFHGTARRFQLVGEVRQVRVIDDYAHHPTEVAATIAAARLVADGARVIVCFQPHLYSRTLDFAEEFGQALAQADEVVVLDVYGAREAPIESVTGELIARAVEAQAGRVRYVPRLEDAVAALVPLARAGDLILTVGAGSVTTLGPGLLAGLER